MLDVKKTFYGDGSIRSIIPYEGDLIHGVAEYFYTNGFIECRIPYTMGRINDGVVPVANSDGEVYRFDTWKNGHCISRNTDNVLVGEYFMENGNTIGEERWYYVSGALQKTAVKANGDYEGVTRCYYEDGTLQSEFNYEKGMRNGPGKCFSESGNLVVSCEYRNGLRHGTRTHFWENGQVAECYHYDNGRICDGDVTFHDAQGNVMFTTHWVDGCRMDYFPNGAVQSQVPYFNGRAQGLSKVFYENGTVKKVAVLKDDKVNGTETTYYANGTLESTTNFANGLRNGKSFHWNEKGLLAWETLFIENIAGDSKLYHYYESGALFIEIEMNNDLPNGIEKIYHENGKLQSRIPYRNGMVVNGTYPVYDEDGEIEDSHIWRNNICRSYGVTGKLTEETPFYKYFINGRHVEYRGDGSVEIENYYYDDQECASKEDFLQRTFKGLAEDVVEQMSRKAYREKLESGEELGANDENSGTVRIPLTVESLENFFRICYENAMASDEAKKNYENYEELLELPPVSEMSEAMFIQKVVREFILRLRLPNDGITELNIIDELQYLVDSAKRTKPAQKGCL